jgi:hypothetical protein
MAGFDRNRPSFEPSKSRLPPEAAQLQIFREGDGESDADADTEMEQDESFISPSLPPPVKPKRKPDILPPPPAMSAPPSASPVPGMVDEPVVDVRALPKAIPRAKNAAEAKQKLQQLKRGHAHLIVPPAQPVISKVDLTATPAPILKPIIQHQQSEIKVNPDIPSAKAAPVPIDTNPLPKQIMKPKIKAALYRSQLALNKVVNQLKTMSETELRASLQIVSNRDLQIPVDMEITPHQGGSYTVPQLIEILTMSCPEYKAYQQVYAMAVQENFDMEEANQFEPGAPDAYLMLTMVMTTRLGVVMNLPIQWMVWEAIPLMLVSMMIQVTKNPLRDQMI